MAEDRPPDGKLVTLWRILLEAPDLLDWERHWAESQRSLYREIYGAAKSIRPKLRVGWHIHHGNSFNPFYRATQDYADLRHYSDFLKVVSYHNCAGPRFARYVRGISRGFLGDHPEADNAQWLHRVLGYGTTQPPLDRLPRVGFSAEYVARETRRALKGVGDEVAIWPGIDIDIPTGPEEARCTPESVEAAVRAALEAGAHGVVLSRKYSEMRLANLEGAGRAVRAFLGD